MATGGGGGCSGGGGSSGSCAGTNAFPGAPPGVAMMPPGMAPAGHPVYPGAPARGMMPMGMMPPGMMPPGMPPGMPQGMPPGGMMPQGMQSGMTPWGYPIYAAPPGATPGAAGKAKDKDKKKEKEKDKEKEKHSKKNDKKKKRAASSSRSRSLSSGSGAGSGSAGRSGSSRRSDSSPSRGKKRKKKSGAGSGSAGRSGSSRRSDSSPSRVKKKKKRKKDGKEKDSKPKKGKEKKEKKNRGKDHLRKAAAEEALQASLRAYPRPNGDMRIASSGSHVYDEQGDPSAAAMAAAAAAQHAAAAAAAAQAMAMARSAAAQERVGQTLEPATATDVGSAPAASVATAPAAVASGSGVTAAAAAGGLAPEDERFRGFQRQDKVEMLSLPRAVIGRIIGKAGATIKDLRERSGARIDARDQTADPVQLLISGTNEAVESAKSMVLDLAEGAAFLAGAPSDSVSAAKAAAEKAAAAVAAAAATRVAGSERALDGVAAAVDEAKDAPAKQAPVASASASDAPGSSKPSVTGEGDGSTGPAPVASSSAGAAASHSEMLEIPGNAVGRVIGAGGARIKEMQDQSGCKIDIDRSNAERPIVRFSGQPEAVASAKFLVQEVLAGRDRLSSGEALITLEVPPSCTGRLIGPGGRQINEIQAKCGAKVDIDKGRDPCIVRMTGSPEAVALAKHMVQEVVQQAGPPPLVPFRPPFGVMRPMVPAGAGLPSMFAPKHDEETIGFDIPPDVVDRVLVSNWTKVLELKTGSRIVVTRTSDGGAHLDIHGQPEQIVQAESLAEDEVRRATALAAAGEPVQPPPPPGPAPNVAAVSKAATASRVAAQTSLLSLPQQSSAMAPAMSMMAAPSMGLQRPMLLSAPASVAIPVAAPGAAPLAAPVASPTGPTPAAGAAVPGASAVTPPWATATTATAPGPGSMPSWLTSDSSGPASSSAVAGPTPTPAPVAALAGTVVPAASAVRPPWASATTTAATAPGSGSMPSWLTSGSSGPASSCPCAPNAQASVATGPSWLVGSAGAGGCTGPSWLAAPMQQQPAGSPMMFPGSRPSVPLPLPANGAS